MPLCKPFINLPICPLVNSFFKFNIGEKKGKGTSIPLPKILPIPRLPKANNAPVAK